MSPPHLSTTDAPDEPAGLIALTHEEDFVRQFFSGISSVALIVAINTLAARADCILTTCVALNLFSYFTINSDIMLVLALLPGIANISFWGEEPLWLTVVRALVVTYVVVSGVTLGLLLLNAYLMNHLFLVPLFSKVMYFVLPTYAVLDFLLAPGRHRLPWRTALLSMVFPLVWTIYTLLRGRMSGWCPYFFLNPNMVGGYAAVSIYAGILAAMILTRFLHYGCRLAAARLRSTTGMEKTRGTFNVSKKRL